MRLFGKRWTKAPAITEWTWHQAIAPHIQEIKMADELTSAQKAAILVAGTRINDTYAVESSDPSVVSVSLEGVPAVWFVGTPAGAGTATITVSKDGRTGTDDITVTDAPLDVTLDTPEDE